MTPQRELASEFILGIREAICCPDVSVLEYEAVMAMKIEAALIAAREEALEEAAAKAGTYLHGGNIASAIRSLKGKKA